MTPIRMLSSPATRAVPAATSGMLGVLPSPMNWPSASLTVAMIKGLSTTM